MSQQPDVKYWLALARLPFFGARRIGKLMRAFPSMERAFSASVTDLLEAGLEPNIANQFLQTRPHINPDHEWENLHTHSISVVTRRDADYPSLLAQLFDPPAVLFYRGTLPDPSRKHLAVVGSRHPSAYGQRVCEQMIEPLARSGAVIVSGLAYGIDAIAHQTTLANKGTTIAVLGSGVDAASIYPSGNRMIASHILANGGALVSEFPIGTPPLPFHFPFRNRIIAGLSHGTLVIEATQKSGSLITARAALDAGRDVYAVPGPIDSPLSEGPNNLLKMGAIPVTCAQDIMEITPEAHTLFSYEPTSQTEREILTHLSHTPIHQDEVIRASHLSAGIVGSTITLLEMKGVIKHEGGRYYTRQK